MRPSNGRPRRRIIWLILLVFAVVGGLVVVREVLS